MTSAFLKKFVSPEQIASTVEEVSRVAKTDGIEIALTGGVALQLYGSDRLTKDVDFLADKVPDEVEAKSQRRLSFGGVGAITATGVPFDIIVRDDDYAGLYEAALNASIYDPELGIKVVPVEYIAVMKFAAARFKDEEDLRNIIWRDAADLNMVREIITEFLGKHSVKGFNSFVDEVEWMKQKQKLEERD